MISVQIYPLIQLIPFVIYNILRKLYYIVAAIAISCLGAKVDDFFLINWLIPILLLINHIYYSHNPS